ncbi:MAG: glycosyltransferase family 4 protein [Acidobacteria bacterium]|nr:glycosyltransferase family 4 protein [Acidobacteriota bacterium]
MKQTLKFCMVSTFYPPYSFGGDGMHIYRLSNELARRGHWVDVFYCEDSFLLMNGGRPTAEFPNHERVRLRPLKSGVGMLSPLITQQTGIPFFKGELKKALEEDRYDVVHYNNMSLIGIKALSYGSAIKLYTVHEHWLVCPMHVLWKFNREVCTTKSCFRCQIGGKRPPQMWRKTSLMKRMLKHVDCFLSPSRFTLQKHLEMGLDIPIRHLPHFLSKPPESTGVSMRHRELRPYFLFVGRLEYIKGVHNLIEAFKKHAGHDLLIVGDGTYRETLEAQAKDFPNIRFLGKLSQDNLADFYPSALAVIVPSICFETFGIILIEAFSYKTPVIANDLGALPEIVNDSNGGFVYRTEDELLAAIQKIAANPALRNELGENGHQAYLKYWTEEPHVRQYLDLIRSIDGRREKKLKAVRGEHAFQ